MKQEQVKDLIFGKYNIQTVLKEVKDSEWQSFRESLKGISTERKIIRLREWVRINKKSASSQIQVTNYIYALKRGGLIK